MTVSGIRAHLTALQEIADANGGIRAIGEPGFSASARYVHDRLEKAGWDVHYDSFPASVFRQLAPTELKVSGGESFADRRDVRAMLYSHSGDLSAPLFPLHLDPDAEAGDGPGCDPSAFDDVPQGAIVLLQPGNCFLREQVVNAQNSGAVAAIFAFPDFTPGEGLRRPTLLSPEGIDIPALAATAAVGRNLNEAMPTEVHLSVRAETPTRELRNVIAESPGGDALDVIMAGAHLDSVIDGPGINDDGSGVATLIEIAEEMSTTPPVNKVRVAFWAGEEYGLLGSRHYVDGLNSLEQRDIAAYLNFDMLGSPNFVPFVYDDSGASAASKAITGMFMKYLSSHGSQGEPVDLAGRSDHYGFENAGIPIGGLFSGAEEVKTSEQQDTYGGQAGAPLDACYHQRCDDVSNIDEDALGLLADAATSVIITLAEREGTVFPAP